MPHYRHTFGRRQKKPAVDIRMSAGWCFIGRCGIIDLWKLFWRIFALMVVTSPLANAMVGNSPHVRAFHFSSLMYSYHLTYDTMLQNYVLYVCSLRSITFVNSCIRLSVVAHLGKVVLYYVCSLNYHLLIVVLK